MSIRVIDMSEQENDGAFGVFIVTLEDGDKLVPVMVWYSLADDRAMVSSKNVDTIERAEAITSDLTLKEEMREAVMAERDSLAEAKTTVDLQTRFEAKVRQEAANIVKWSNN